MPVAEQDTVTVFGVDATGAIIDDSDTAQVMITDDVDVMNTDLC